MSLPDNPPIVFMDTETTSLRPDRRAWDVAAIRREPDGAENEMQMFVQLDDLDLGNADHISLTIGRFHDRHPQMGKAGRLGPQLGHGLTHTEFDMLQSVEAFTRGAVIVGAVPNFDTEVIAARMRRHGLSPSWHYHLVDVETLAAGQLGLKPPWSFDQILDTYGITVDEEKRHTALGDAYLNLYLYDAVYDRASGNPLPRAHTGFIGRGGATFPLEPGLAEVFDNAKQAETGETR
jgi:hypothetical protein